MTVETAIVVLGVCGLLSCLFFYLIFREVWGG
jgi:hypothetical protein